MHNSPMVSKMRGRSSWRLSYWIIITGLFCNITSQINGLYTYLRACDSEDLAIRKRILYPVLYNQTTTYTLSTYDTASKTHKNEVTIGIRYKARDYTLKLRHNSNIMSARPYKDSGLLLDTHKATDKELENCYYQGFVQNSLHVEDFATVSTCNGLRGIVHFNGEAFSIKPLMLPNKPQLCLAHEISKLETTSTSGRCENDATSQWTSFTKLHSTEYHKQLSNSGSQTKVKRNLESKHLALGLVVDQKMSELFDHNGERIRDYLLDVTNLIDLYYQRLNVRVGLVYLKLWTSANEIVLTQRTKETLQNFLIYSESVFSTQSVDSLHLLSGIEFEDGSSGLSIPDSICTDRALSVISVQSLISNQEKLASTIAHMIGHNIGLEHDTQGCQCVDGNGICIMSDMLGDGPSYRFSSCSMERFEMLTQVKLGQCLSSQPDSSHYTQICGNGIIERGEQCDCGPIGTCGQLDPCCNATTCLLKSWATCRSGECCEDCLPKSTQSQCRAARNDCDAPEFCNGVSGECPVDEAIQNGEPCDGGEGICYHGHCPTRTKQCQLLWGDNAESSKDTCYNTNNLLGSVYGHCGQTTDGYYQRCSPQNAACGLLQCEGGDNSPIIPDVKHSMTTTNVDSQDEITCKTINSVAGSHQFNKGLVSDGTKCSENHLCMGYSCVHVSTLYARGCPVSPITNTSCSGNGRCTTSMQCSCDVGYTGRLCDVIISLPPALPSVTYPPPSTEKQQNKGGISTGVISGILITTLLLITVIISTVFLYRRRVGCFDKLKRRKSPSMKDSPAVDSRNGSIVSYDIAYPAKFTSVEIRGSRSAAGGSGGRRRRIRRRRHHSSSSEGSSSSDDGDQSELPCVIYDVPVQHNLPKGILKRPAMSGDDNSECSDSQCSCGNHSSTCSEGDEMPNNITSIPKPDTDELQCDASPSHSSDAKLNSSPEADQQLHIIPSYQQVICRVNNDSASDSAIEMLPHGDSSMSTLNESSAFSKVSPPHHVSRRPPPRIHYVTALHPVSDYNSPSSNTLIEHSTDNTIEPKLAPDRLYNSHSDTVQTNINIPQPQEQDVCDPSESLLEAKENTTAIECPNMYSIRPQSGPMRTFLPIEKQPKPTNIYDQEMAEFRRPFLS